MARAKPQQPDDDAEEYEDTDAPEEYEGETPYGGSDEIDDWEIAGVQTKDQSADDIEESLSFRRVPPGDHTLVVAGFLGPPKEETLDYYLNGKRRTLKTFSVIVKFALPSDPTSQVTDYFLLPPDEPKMAEVYNNGSKNPDGKTGVGFMANKFYHFIDRLGFTYEPGELLPVEARRLGNWKGRKIRATVEAGQSYTKTHAVTGEEVEKSGRNQIKLFSYRPDDSDNSAEIEPPTRSQRPQRPSQAGQHRGGEGGRPSRPSGRERGGDRGLDAV